MSAPYYQDDLVTLYHGDCREETAWLKADLLAFDPPYGRGWYQRAFTGRAGRRARAGIAGDTDTAVRDAVLAMWGPRRALVFGDPMLSRPDGTVHVAVYPKPQDAGRRGGTASLRRDVEEIFLVGPWPRNVGTRSSLFPTACQAVSGTYGLAAKAGHPHAKPLDVCMDLIRLDPDATCVADTTCGSGQLLIAARLLGLRAIGVELVEADCENTARRLERAAANLFAGASPVAVTPEGTS